MENEIRIDDIITKLRPSNAHKAEALEYYYLYYKDNLISCKFDNSIRGLSILLYGLNDAAHTINEYKEINSYIEDSLFPDFVRSIKSCPLPSTGDTTKDLQDSIDEEKAAAEQYNVRLRATNGDDLETKKVYNHVINEENEHYVEFKKRLYQMENQGEDTVSMAELQRRAKAELGIS